MRCELGYPTLYSAAFPPWEERLSFSALLGSDFSLGATSAHILSVAILREAASVLHSAVWALTGWGTQYFSFVPISVLLHFYSLFMLFFLLAYFLILNSSLAPVFISLWQLPQPVRFTGFYNHFFFIIISKIISIFIIHLICCHFLLPSYVHFWVKIGFHFERFMSTIYSNRDCQKSHGDNPSVNLRQQGWAVIWKTYNQILKHNILVSADSEYENKTVNFKYHLGYLYKLLDNWISNWYTAQNKDVSGSHRWTG